MNGEKEKTPITKGIILGLIIFIVALLAISIGIFISSSNKDVITSTQNDNEIIAKKINIDDESRTNIKKLYSEVSGYGSSNIIKAMYWKLADGTPSIIIAYNNPDRNGMYITINGTTINKCYGDEEELYTGRTKRQEKELTFSMYKDDKEHTYFTGEEFRSIIK